MTNQNDKDNEKDFPGYPHYPSNEDIMNSKNNERVNVDVENLSRSNQPTSSELPDKSVRTPEATEQEPLLGDVDDDAPEANKNNDADLTPDDLIALGESEANFGTVDKLETDDLDIPGAEDDDANEEIGEEDEENNYYSLGGDAHENLEEDKA